MEGRKRPEVIHCHDWQTAAVPVLLDEISPAPSACTISAVLLHHPQFRASGCLRRAGVGGGDGPDPARAFL